MGTHHLALLFSLLLVTGHVTSFSISNRHERSTDLAEALAILQRQRRRVGGDYLDSERLLGGSRPLTLGDISDWLSTSDSIGSEVGPLDNGLDSAWMASDGQFKDFEPRLGYGIPVAANVPPRPVSVEPSQQELEDIFSDNAEDGSSSDSKSALDALPEKKKKEEMMNVQGDKKIVQKKSISSDIANAVAAAEASEALEDDGDISLDTLTKEEFRALMKAVGKLQKQALRLSEKAVIEEPDAAKVAVVETMSNDAGPEEMAIVQPASQEELQSVFEEVKEPGVKETDVIVESPPDANGNRVIEKETIVSGVSPSEAEAIQESERELTQALTTELEDDMEAEEEREEAAAAEAEAAAEELEEEVSANNLATLGKYWLMNKYLDQAPPMKKRTAKRAVGLYPSPVDEFDVDDIDVDDIANDELSMELTPPALGKFVAKILELQSEVDRLRMVSRLEDLENDVLTDALNEATLAQKEGSVSDMEFESLQQAIRIEEALQELKGTEGEDNSLAPTDVIKRGEPWRRRSGPDVESGSDLSVVDDLPPYQALSPVESSPRITKDDLERLLGQSYLMRERDEEDEDEDSEVASLFMSNADQCPAVQEYSTNCELADLYSLPVDYEARALCNLHEMCYACGNSLRVSQEHCDFVYRAAATALCQEKENCVLESEIFLRTMKLKTRYIPHPQPKCRSTCAAKFLGIL